MISKKEKTKFELELQKGLKVISIVLLSMLLLTKIFDFFN
jgi:hypothetical protein